MDQGQPCLQTILGHLCYFPCTNLLLEGKQAMSRVSEGSQEKAWVDRRSEVAVDAGLLTGCWAGCGRVLLP